MLAVGAVVLAACSSSGPAVGGDDASADAFTPDDAAADATDGTAPRAIDAGPLWESCDPSNVASCPSGLECFGAHTSPSDVYGKCVFTCAGASGPACALSDGTCACPLTSSGGAGDCAAGNAAGSVTVCVPAGDAGPSGENQIEDAGVAEDAGSVGDARTD